MTAKKSDARTTKSGARTMKSGARTTSLDALVRAQQARLGLDGSIAIAGAKQAAAFVARVAIALRYGPTPTLPLASMYAACGAARDEAAAQRCAALVTNELLDQRAIVEINCVADRVAVVHRDVAPALIALRRRGRAIDELGLSDDAHRAIEILREHPRPTAGFVRTRWGVPPKTWPNPADDALAELQRATVIDRGPTDVPERGAAYLGKEGIPYRFVDDAHADLVRAAAALDVAAAARALLAAYLRGAVFAHRRKLASMFAACCSAGELGTALDELAAADDVEVARVDGKELIVARRGRV